MSAATAPPPPPPPGGNDPRKFFSGQGAPGKEDALTKETAMWVIGARNKHKCHFIVHRRTEGIKWIRCHFKHAIEDFKTGFEVYDSVDSNRVRFVIKGAAPKRTFPFSK